MKSSENQPIIEVQGISKRYQLGGLGVSSLRDATQEWWERRRQRKARTQEDIKTRAAGYTGGRSNAEKVFWALRDLTFNIHRGEVVGLLGRNGAGKSTLLKILSRITEPTEGRAVLRGRVASLLEVGTGFHPDLSGRENIYLNGAILGMKRTEIVERFDAIVDFAEIGAFIDTPVKRYSSGMYTRLAFAIAAHLEAEILLVDEVLAVGDVGFQKKCMGKMQGIAHTGRTVIFVSHNIQAMEQLCQRCFYLANGQLKQQGPAKEVIDEYQREFVTKAENGFEGASKWGDGRITLHSYQVTNSQGEEYPPPSTGETVEIHVRMTVHEAVARPNVAIRVHSAQGVVMLNVSSEDLMMELPPMAEGEHEFVIRLKDVPFTPGSYVASIWIITPQWHIYAGVEGAMPFDIGQSTLYGTQEVDHRFGCVYVPLEFELSPVVPSASALVPA